MPTYTESDKDISIHVPLAGNVVMIIFSCAKRQYFYPRSPCGERLVDGNVQAVGGLFLSTFPLRGTSKGGGYMSLRAYISIHVPLAGNVDELSASIDVQLHFYPRSPCGERHPMLRIRLRLLPISIHVPLAGNVSLVSTIEPVASSFLSTFPLRGTSEYARC